MKLLIIEDDPTIVDTVSLVFELSWPEVEMISCATGIDGINLIKRASPDIVILDIGLPDMDGFEVLVNIRQFSYVPVMILTARTQPDSIVKGLESGADDYITKPFNPMVLIARVKSVMRRNHPTGTAQGKESLVFGDLVVDFASREVTLRGTPVKLTSTEWSLLNYLALNEGKIVPYKELWDKVWGSEFIEDVSAIRTCIWRLRAKLCNEGTATNMIESYRSLGYRFVRPK